MQSNHSRKRSSAWIEQDENENVSLAYAPVNLIDLPAKRLQNRQGAPVHAKRLLKYDAQKLLSNLAFTSFYVTANFHNFNPTASYITLCMVSEQNGLYQALWYRLPSANTLCVDKNMADEPAATSSHPSTTPHPPCRRWRSQQATSLPTQHLIRHSCGSCL